METLNALLQDPNPKYIISLLLPLLLLPIFIHRIKSYLSNTFPINWPFLGMLPSLLLNYHRLHDFLSDTLLVNGGTEEFKGPWFSRMNFVITGDPIDINHIANLNFPNYPNGEEYHEIFDVLGDGIFVAEADSWRNQRKMSRAFLTAPRFRSFIASCTQDKVEKALLPFLNKMADLGEPFDLQDVCTRLTYDTTCILVFGVDPCSLGFDLPTLPFAEALDVVEEVLLYRHSVPMFYWKLLRWLELKMEKKMVKAWEELDRFILRVITERRAKIAAAASTSTPHLDNGLLPLDLLTSFMNSNSNSNSDSYPDTYLNTVKTDQFLRDTILTFLAAGKDTVGSALTWFFWLVSTNRHVEAKILQELQDTEFTTDDMSKLVYLHASISETLRLYPPVPFNHKKSVNPDVLPSGHCVNAQTMVLISPYVTGRMEKVWGEDCLEFRPERWITEEGKVRHEPSYKFLAFSTGPRICLGKDMSFTQMKMVAAAVLPKFQFELVEGHVVVPKLSIVMYMRNGLMGRLKKRVEA